VSRLDDIPSHSDLPSALHLTFEWTPRYSIGVSNREATLGPSHGYAIAARIEQVSNGRLQLNMGTLYPGLMRLEQRRAIRGSWGTTDNNRKALLRSHAGGTQAARSREA
jgi:hypothetical protein